LCSDNNSLEAGLYVFPCPKFNEPLLISNLAHKRHVNFFVKKGCNAVTTRYTFRVSGKRQVLALRHKTSSADVQPGLGAATQPNPSEDNMLF